MAGAMDPANFQQLAAWISATSQQQQQQQPVQPQQQQQQVWATSCNSPALHCNQSGWPTEWAYHVPAVPAVCRFELPYRAMFRVYSCRWDTGLYKELLMC